jgi:hypothetical protein
VNLISRPHALTRSLIHALLPLSRFLILPPSIPFNSRFPATSPHALPILPAEQLSPGPFQSPLDLLPSYILRLSSSPSRQQQAYLPPAPAVPVSPLLTSFTLLSLLVLVLVLLIALYEANISVATFPETRTLLRVAARRESDTSPSLVCSPLPPVASPHIVSYRRSIETSSVKCAALTNQAYIQSRLSCFTPIWTVLDWADPVVPVFDSTEL